MVSFRARERDRTHWLPQRQVLSADARASLKAQHLVTGVHHERLSDHDVDGRGLDVQKRALGASPRATANQQPEPSDQCDHRSRDGAAQSRLGQACIWNDFKLHQRPVDEVVER